MPRIAEGVLLEFAHDVLIASGLGEDDAAATARGLLEATKRGVSTHGVFRLPQYSKSIRVGAITARPNVAVLSRSGSTALVDAGGGYGFRPTQLAVDVGVEIARSTGVALVGVRNSHHFGAAAIYTNRVAKTGMIGLVSTTTKARIAPIGAMGPVVGNNPISIAVPRRPPSSPITLDMALSQVAMGRVRMASAARRTVPEGWGFDSEGRPTTDPDAILNDGLLAAIGAHKGYALSVMIELLAGALTGSRFGRDADNHQHAEGGVGHIVMVIAPDFLRDSEEFLDDVERLVDQIKARPAAKGAEGPLLPGDLEDRNVRDAAVNGVPISDELLVQLQHLARELDLEFPDTALEIVSKASADR